MNILDEKVSKITYEIQFMTATGQIYILRKVLDNILANRPDDAKRFILKKLFSYIAEKE